jgi:hypothetical protein
MTLPFLLMLKDSTKITSFHRNKRRMGSNTDGLWKSICGRIIMRPTDCTVLISLWHSKPNRDKAASLLRFLDQTQLDTHTQPLGLLWTSDRPVADAATRPTYNNQTFMPLSGFESAIPAIKKPQTCSIDPRVTGVSDYPYI